MAMAPVSLSAPITLRTRKSPRSKRSWYSLVTTPMCKPDCTARCLSPDEQRAVQSGLHMGVVTNEYQERFDRGDFLVRNVIGADKDTGAIAIGDYVRVGQTVQFHV